MTFALAAGKLDRQIRIERAAAPVHDGYQNVPGPLEVLARPFAQWLPGPGNERFSAAENAATVTGRFRIYWTSKLDPDRIDPDAPGLNAKDFVRYPARPDGRLYEIVAAVTMGRRAAIEISVIARSDT